MIDHAILVGNGQAEQQLSVVLCLFKQSRQNLVQGIALFQEQDAEHLVQLIVLLQLEILASSSAVKGSSASNGVVTRSGSSFPLSEESTRIWEGR